MIGSTISKDKRNKKTTYSFAVNNDVFEANYFSTRKPKLEIISNNSVLGVIERPNAKSEYVINQETNPVKITAWIDKGNITGKVNGIGLEVNGEPIQHTLADPEIHIKKGRLGLCFLLLILLLKVMVGFHNNVYLIYLIPLIIVLTAAIKYKSWTEFSIIAGLILAILEMLEYVFTVTVLPSLLHKGYVFFWSFVRIGIINLLFNAWKWKRKFCSLPLL
jgi:hypothetical protein